MELNKTDRLIYFLTSLLGLIVLTLGAWWLYLIYKLSHIIQELKPADQGESQRFLNMIQWEGAFFLLMILMASLSLIFLYWRDQQKTKGVQAFFSSLTHELKTPLASMKLQAEVIKDLILDEKHDHEQLTSLTEKLIEDTSQFESELEKNLQLSRIEQNAPLQLDSLSLPSAIKKFLKPYQKKLDITYLMESAHSDILGDELAIKTIFKNLAENTLRHCRQKNDKKKINLRFKDNNSYLVVEYDDQGEPFRGDKKKLGHLFYKYQSQKGTGIGLYLIKELVKKMQGKIEIKHEPHLVFILSFKKATQDE